MKPFIILMLILTSVAFGTSDQKEMEDFSYREGIIEFELPSEWKKRMLPEGGAVFYLEGGDTGALWLEVLTFEKGVGPFGKETDTASNPLASAGFETFRDDLFIRKKIGDPFISNERISLLTTWEIGYTLDTGEYRVVTLTHSILHEKKDDPDTKIELEVIKNIIETATFGRKSESTKTKTEAEPADRGNG